jgi:acyl carrier protein
MHQEIERRVRAFIEESFLFNDTAESLRADQSLLEAELIDSTGVLELVAFLEAEFAIQMADADIVPENLDSIQAIVGFVAARTAPVTVAA